MEDRSNAGIGPTTSCSPISSVTVSSDDEDSQPVASTAVAAGSATQTKPKPPETKRIKTAATTAVVTESDNGAPRDPPIAASVQSGETAVISTVSSTPPPVASTSTGDGQPGGTQPRSVQQTWSLNNWRIQLAGLLWLDLQFFFF